MEFEELRNRLRQARRARESAEKSVSRNRRGLQRLDLEQRSLLRSHERESDAFQELESRERRLSASLAGSEGDLERTVKEHGGLLSAFETFTDPREHLDRLDDDYPILLFPLRLETRFKIVEGRDGAQRHQLWVRVFPDECSVDTFDDTLSESEIARAKRYWTALWAAGKPADAALESIIEDRRRGAWRKLMGLFNAGRAYWITQSYRPADEDAIPERADPSDVLLVIPTEDPPSEPARSALETYWAAHFEADGDRIAVDAALAALRTAAGVDDAGARRLLERYVPANLEEEEPSGGAVRVRFLVFPESDDAKIVAWSQAARVRTLPDKLVLLGYRDDLEEPVVQALGRRIPDPLIVGPDTRDDVEAVLREAYGDTLDDWTDDEKAARYVEYLSERADTRWLFDFDAAVDMGMGFRVDLSPEQYEQGFRRLIVTGVRLSADASAGGVALEDLLRSHHFGDSGLSLVAQGTPTNNTEEGGAGYSETESADEAFDRYFGTRPPAEPGQAALDPDGRRLADRLGIDPTEAGLPFVENYHGGDQREARAMNTALWNATIGYFLESMATPATSEPERELIRRFLIDHVRGRGSLPALRIGDQPYGILPISDLTDPGWLKRMRVPSRRLVDARAFRGMSGEGAFLARLFAVLSAVRADWEALVDRVAHVGADDGDAHRTLLQALGLHAQSVELDRRIAESFQQIKNAYYAQGVLGDDIDNLDLDYFRDGLALLEKLGYEHDTELDPEIPILEKSFFGTHEDVTKDLVDDRPLSETDPIRAYTDDGENYIGWLIRNARESHANIRDQKGFTDGDRPSALLYDMLRHAVNLEFGNTGLDLHRKAGILTPEEASSLRIDPGFIGVRDDTTALESKWDVIYRRDPRIAGEQLVADRISRILLDDEPEDSARNLKEVVDALEVLRDVPTARLERCFVEHLDCCSYRLDAWLLGLLDVQLETMRARTGRAGSPAGDAEEDGSIEGAGGGGIYLGAYGWLEDLEPQSRELSPVPLDEELAPIFDPEGEGDIVSDESNGGYVHAPSINHAVTAAVLRNAYISAADEDDAERYQVNLSSERVRMALSVIEGMQQGQSLAALLGYRLERALHDDNDEELDVFIYELRKVFPLVSNRMNLTAVVADKTGRTPEETARHAEEEAEFEEDRAITKVEARNVVNGLALLERVKSTGEASYPFGFPLGSGPDKLKPASDDEAAAIDRGVQLIMNIRDAVADLAIAESVHQVVQGNYDRAAGALDAYSKGDFPQLPHVVQSPASGVSLTHRFAVHLRTDVGPGVGTTPRSKAEPGVNAWLEELLPSAGAVGCEVRFREPAYGTGPAGPWSTFPVTMADMGLEPIDLLYLQDVEQGKHLGALDDHALKAFRQAEARRPDLEVEIDYTISTVHDFTFFELAALIAPLRKLIVAARPVEAADIHLSTDAAGAEKLPTSSVDPARISAAKAMLDDALSDLATGFVDVFRPLVDDEDVEVGLANAALILGQIDARSTSFVDEVSRLSLFGFQQAGSGHVYDRRAAIHRAVFSKLLDHRTAWDERTARYDELVGTDLPAATDDDQRIDILHRAEAQVSTTLTSDFGSVAELQGEVSAKRSAFDTQHDAVTDFLDTDFVSLSDLFAAGGTLVGGFAPFDLEPPDLVDELRQVVILAEDLLKQAEKLHAAGSTRSQAVQDLLDTEAASASPEERLGAMREAATVLLGEDFQVVPLFTLGEEQGLELDKCWDDRAELLAHQRTERDSDFPVDDWLYGVARVREKMAAWERVVVLAEGFRDRPPLDLTPIQLPHREEDSWVALEYPESYVMDGDKLLYTAFMDGFDRTASQCGLLVDEWTEVVPAGSETTGMVFHYDQPNSEPPQTLLLATPSDFRGHWAWQDLVGALHEALALARLRAVEPDLVESLPDGYGRFLPMTVATMTYHPVTMALDYQAREVATTAFAAAVPFDG